MRPGSWKRRRARPRKGERTWWTAPRTSTGPARAWPMDWRSWRGCSTPGECGRRPRGRRRCGGPSRKTRTESRGMTSVTQWLLLLNIGAHLLLGPNQGLRYELAFVPALVLVKPWTLLTYMFVHANLMHLLMNMLGLFFFGPRLEARLGGRAFLGLYVVSGLGGALLSVFSAMLGLFPP